MHLLPEFRDNRFEHSAQLRAQENALANSRQQRAYLLALRHAYIERKFSADQPRVPAGNPNGGQWARLGGGSIFEGYSSIDSFLIDQMASTDWVSSALDMSELPDYGTSPEGSPISPIAGNETGGRQNRIPLVDIREDDAMGEGHTYERHVHKSEDYLIARVREKQMESISEYERSRSVPDGGFRAGSFSSIESANKLINATLATNPSLLLEVMMGERRDAIFRAMFGGITGQEAYAAGMYSTPYIRPTNGVVVYVQHDPRSPRGFWVHTAYPARRR